MNGSNGSISDSAQTGIAKVGELHELPMEVDVAGAPESLPSVCKKEQHDQHDEPDNTCSAVADGRLELAGVEASHAGDGREGPSKKSRDSRDFAVPDPFRLVVQNLPKYFGFKQLKSWFSKIGVNPTKIKPVMGRGRRGMAASCFLNFRSKDEKDTAIRLISTTPFSGSVLSVKDADSAPDPNHKFEKRQRGRPDNCRDGPSEPKNPELEILDIVTNLHRLTYPDQLTAKRNHAIQMLRKIAKKFQYNSQGTIQWLKDIKGGLVCNLEDIKPSPVFEKYRNKCEFSIGYSPSGERVIGFKLGKFKEGTIFVISPVSCTHINDLMKHIVKVFEAFICSSPHKPLNEKTREGHWHQLTVRTNAAQESMVCIHFHPQKLSSEVISLEKERLRTFCQNLPVSDVPNYVYWVLDDKLIMGQRRFEGMSEELLYGKEPVEFAENLLGYRFQISPDAFFQVNTPAAEILYSTILEASEVTANTIVLDLCCGTGTIGIVMSKHVKQVYGVELSEAAVADAVQNSTRNGINNTEFICASVESALDGILRTKIGLKDDVVVVLDPPRSGVPASVIEALRKSERIRRVIYVACDADNDYTITNLYGLCRNKAKDVEAGETPFRPVRCIPVDLFPLIKNIELIFVFDREQKTDSPLVGKEGTMLTLDDRMRSE